MHVRRRLCIGIVAVSSVIAAGCSGDDDEANAGSGAASGTGEPATATVDVCDAADVGPIELVALNQVAGESPVVVEEQFFGVELGVEALNEQCGTEVVTLDRVPMSLAADQEAEARLVEALESDPTGIIGIYSGTQAPLVRSVIDEYDVPVLGQVTNEVLVGDAEGASDVHVMVRPPTELYGGLAGSFLAEQEMTSVWLECVDTTVGELGCDAAEDALSEAGVDIANRRTHGLEETDFTQAIVDMKSAGVDALLLSTFPGPQSAILDQLTESGYDGLRVIANSSTSSIWSTLSPESQAALWSTADCNPRESAPEVNDAYVAEHGEHMTDVSANPYDSVFLLAAAVVHAGSTEHEAVRDALLEVRHDGVCQTYYDGGEGTRVLAHQEVILSWEGGEPTTVATYELDEAGTGVR